MSRKTHDVASYIFGGLLIVGVITLIFSLFNKKEVNPEIFDAFRKIEAQCATKTDDACIRVNALKSSCDAVPFAKGTPPDCYADSYYRKLDDLGFNLPPLYVD